MSLDVVKVRGVLERRVFPVQLLHPPNPGPVSVCAPTYRANKPVDIRISMADIADITFEMPDIDWIKADLDRLQRVRAP